LAGIAHFERSAAASESLLATSTQRQQPSSRNYKSSLTAFFTATTTTTTNTSTSVAMPYESFTPQQQVEITEVVQDAATSAWMYVLHVQRGNTSTHSSPRGPVEEGFSHEYVISRRFSEFKQLHAALVPVMGDALTPLPADGLLTLILADNQALLDERRQVLAQIVMDVLNHPVARDLPDVLEFLGHESISAKVMAPLSGQCTGSIRKTSSPAWTSSCRTSAVMSS
jgi:hypothetical protein